MSIEKPTITVLMLSYQDEAILDECLASVRNQTYDQSLVKIMLADGGSTDGTEKIARKYNADFISRPDLRDRPELRGALAARAASTDLVISISADNRLQEQDTLEKMVETFVDPFVIGCTSWRYGFRKTDPAMSRYFALIGGNDPIAVGLGKADRAPHDAQAWHSFGSVEDRGGWYRVKFEKDVAKVPTLGANGFMCRRELIAKSQYADYGTHIDLCFDLIRQGYDCFAFVKDRHVIHFIDIGLLPFVKRRLQYAQTYSKEFVPRIYSVFQTRDLPRLVFILVAYPTLLIPFIRALKGYWAVRDPAWFLHPLMCAVFTASYSFHFVKKFAVRIFVRKPQVARMGLGD